MLVRSCIALALILAAAALLACKDGGSSTASRDTTSPAGTPVVRFTATPVSHAQEVTAAVPEYASAIARGDRPYVIDHLHATAKHFYGAQTCRDYLSQIAADPTFNIEVHDIAGPAPWTWEVYGERIAILPDAYTLNVTITQQGQSREAEVHFTWDAEAGKLRVFSPCVPPPEG